MKKILLMGNPNVGKSVVFSRLTGSNVVSSNYPGTTVDFTKGKMMLDGERCEVIDVPGTYSLSPGTKAEEVAAEMLADGDIVINVLDSTNLERNLFLTFELLERDVRMVVALNLWDEAKIKGIDIDFNKLQEILKVPVVPIVALTGEGIKEIVSQLKNASTRGLEEKTEDERWAEIGRISRQVETIEHKHPSLKERIAEATIKPVSGLPIALVVLFVTFQLIRYVGEGLITYGTEPFFESVYKPIIVRLSHFLTAGSAVHDVVIGQLIDGEVQYLESMGVLTTGVFVPLGVVLPYIVAFYSALALLEDSGYLPRLATLVDNIFHRLGMHGQGVIPLLLGVGCNVPGVLATRTLETRRERLISATLVSISVPCMAQTAMIFGVLAPYGIGYVYLIFGVLAAVYLTVGLILNRFVGGESPEIFLEIPPYRRPSLTTVYKKTLMRVRWFVKDAVPWLVLGVLLVNLLYVLGVLQWLGTFLGPVVSGVFGLPEGSVSALLIGFLRKDLAIGMLLGLNMSPFQLVIAATILTIYFPCAATFATLFRELGPGDLVKSIGIMLITVLIVGSLLNLILGFEFV